MVVECAACAHSNGASVRMCALAAVVARLSACRRLHARSEAYILRERYATAADRAGQRAANAKLSERLCHVFIEAARMQLERTLHCQHILELPER